MSNWIPEGSIPYGMTSEEAAESYQNHGFVSDSMQAEFSTTPYKGETTRNPKKCHAGDFTCKGWKAKGTDFCVGHLKSKGRIDEDGNMTDE